MNKVVIGDCTLIQGDCLEVMSKAKGPVDLVLCDPPYGTTACKWDSIIPLEAMWEQLNRIIKQDGPLVFTASQPFTSVLITSQLKLFKHCWVWDKRYPANYPQAKRQPMKRHEDIVVFNSSAKTYFPLMLERDAPIVKGANKGANVFNKGLEREDYNKKVYTHKYPESIIYFPTRQEGTSLHPTQKPVALMGYLIRTYSNEGETVLDFAMGSGTTGIACIQEGRKFIGIEKDENYFNVAVERIEKYYQTHSS